MQMPELTLGQAGGHLKHMLGAEGAYAAANAQVRCRRVASRISWRLECDPGDPDTRRIIAPGRMYRLYGRQVVALDLYQPRHSAQEWLPTRSL